jgi:hypothetical protein
MDYVVGDALVSLERGHLTRLGLWAAASIAAGVLAAVGVRRTATDHQAFWRHFGIQSVAWGGVDLLIVAFAWNGIAARDLAGAIALDRFLWLNIGLDVGYVMLGATLLAFGWRAPRRPGLVGAGVAIIAQGAALAILDARLSAYIVRSL